MYWSPYLVLALFHGGEVVRIESPRCRHGGVDRERLHRLLLDFATRFWPEEVVIEARTAGHLGLRPRGGQVRTMTIAEVKRALLSGRAGAAHRDMYEHLLAEDPSLARYIEIKRSDHRASLARFWPTARLLTVALGWAAFRPPGSVPSIYS